MTGLPDDPSDRPTRLTEIVDDLTQQRVLEREPDSAPTPWYRNRVLLGLWALMAGLLLALIIYGIVELSRGGGTSIPAPHSSTTPTTSSTTSPSPTTTTETPPPPEQTSEEAPPPPVNNSPAPAEPPRHHHHWHLPHLF